MLVLSDVCRRRGRRQSERCTHRPARTNKASRRRAWRASVTACASVRRDLPSSRQDAPQTDSLSAMEAREEIACVIYAAKSSEDRRGSIPDQLLDCRNAVSAQPERLAVAEYVDEAFSAYTGNRGPGLAEALQHAADLAEERGGAELWAQHSDRLARGDGLTARHTVEIALWALKHEVKIRTIQDPDTFRDLLYAVVTGQRNHEDSRRKSLAVQAGRRRAAARGDFVGYKPDGYKLAVELDEWGAVKKRMVMDPERRPMIETMFSMALAGERPATIKKALNDAGWLTKPTYRRGRPDRWQIGHVMRLLGNPRYAGLAIYGGEIVARGHWPAYITEEEHDRIRAVLAERRPTKAPRQIESYLLARLVRCGRCGRGMYSMTGQERSDGTFARRYMCSGRRAKPPVQPCQARVLEASTVEAMFVTVLRTLLLDRVTTIGHAVTLDRAIPLRAAAREELVTAVLADDRARIDLAIERIVAASHPQQRESAISRRRARELTAAERFDVWLEREQGGRSEDTRREALELNRLLRDWFSSIELIADEGSVHFLARRRRRPNVATQVAPVEARVDLREWCRHAPPSGSRDRRFREWSRPEIIGSLQAWIDDHGREPTWLDLKLRRGACPSAQTILHHFGSLETALSEAKTGPLSTPQAFADSQSDGAAIWALAGLRTPAPLSVTPKRRSHTRAR